MLSQQLSTASKQCFWPLMFFFFYPLDIELQWSRTDKNSTLWFSFRLHLKCHPQSEDYAPRHNHQFLKHSIFLSVSQLEKSIFLDLVLLRFTPHLLPTLIDLLDGQLLIVRQLHCHVPVSEFSTQWIQSGKKSNVGRLCMNHTLKSILTFTLLIFRAKQGVWYKQIQLMKGSDFLIIISSQHFIGNTFTHTALWELHADKSNFLPLPVFFFKVSSAITDITHVLVIIRFPWSRQACYQSTLISRMSFFPSSGQSTCTNGNLWVLLQALLFLASRGFVARSLAHSRVARLARPKRRACPRATSSSSLS